jgi:uncharacterized RmlC-like cupin family protein
MSTPPASGTRAERTCTIVRSTQTYVGKQGLTYSAGVYAENTGARAICLHLLTIPPGGRAKAHLHANHESAVYMLSGEVVVFHGEGLRQRDVMQAGDFIFIPASVPHLPINASETEPATAVIARTDPNEQESVVLLPELDALVA